MGKSAEAYDESRMKNIGLERQQRETEGKMRYRDFEDYLCMRFMRENPHYLDDDYPDVFSDYIAEIDPTELIGLADEYVKEVVNEL